MPSPDPDSRLDPTLPALLARAAWRSPDAEAARAGSWTQSYAELDEAARGFATLLQVTVPDQRRVALLLPNGAAWPTVWFGLLAAGRSALLLNPLLSPREVAESLADAGVRCVITHSRFAPLVPREMQALLVDGWPASIQALGSGSAVDLPIPEPGGLPAAIGPEAEAAVVFTAATDGKGRGAVLSHANLLANAAATVEAMRLVPADTLIAVLPLIHLFGLTVTLNAAIAAGASVHLHERFHPIRLADSLAEGGGTVLVGVPAMYAALADVAAKRGRPAHCLRIAVCGGSQLPRAVARAWEQHWGLPIREGYGLTEAAPVCLFNRVDRPPRPGALGYPFPGVEVSIRGPHGEPLPTGEVGEICVRGPNVFAGYLNEGGRRAADFWDDWLRTGDLGEGDPDGAIRFRGLLKPMFTRNGFNVYPREVERGLIADPRVRAVTVCSVPEPGGDSALVLLVTPEPGVALSEDEVREICKQRLAAYKQPNRILFAFPDPDHA